MTAENYGALGEDHPSADEFGPSQATASPPVDVFATVLVDGERMTRFEVKADETVSVHFERQDADP